MKRSFTIWLTGLPDAGKGMLARLTHEALQSCGVTKVEVLDSDVVRTHLFKGAGPILRRTAKPIDGQLEDRHAREFSATCLESTNALHQVAGSSS